MNTFPPVDPSAATPSFAAPAPLEDDDDAPPLNDKEQTELHGLCEDWVAWTYTRRMYAPPSRIGSVLGKLTGGMRPVHNGGPDALNNPLLAAFHLAYLVQPDSLDKEVFNAHYVVRAKPVKSSASLLGISRQHYYRLLGEFRIRVHALAKHLQANNEAARDALPHWDPNTSGR
jgi:hypothetical protein